MTAITTDARLIDAVARSLAKMDEKFVSAADWGGNIGDNYRVKAMAVLLVVENYNNGIRSGGLPTTAPCFVCQRRPALVGQILCGICIEWAEAQRERT
jgi:hypothetical protein